MKRIPRSAQVSKSIRRLAGSIMESWRGINREAAKATAKGNYAAAEELVGRGRRVKEFLGSVEALKAAWRVLEKERPSAPGKTTASRLPQWEYYQPVLQALVELGGEARKGQIEGAVERLLSSRLQAGDRDLLSGGRARWQVMVHRARRHMRAEGWIEDSGGPVWRITGEGRRVGASKVITTSPKAKQDPG